MPESRFLLIFTRLLSRNYPSLNSSCRCLTKPSPTTCLYLDRSGTSRSEPRGHIALWKRIRTSQPGTLLSNSLLSLALTCSPLPLSQTRCSFSTTRGRRRGANITRMDPRVPRVDRSGLCFELLERGSLTKTFIHLLCFIICACMQPSATLALNYR